MSHRPAQRDQKTLTVSATDPGVARARSRGRVRVVCDGARYRTTFGEAKPVAVSQPVSAIDPFAVQVEPLRERPVVHKAPIRLECAPARRESRYLFGPCERTSLSRRRPIVTSRRRERLDHPGRRRRRGDQEGVPSRSRRSAASAPPGRRVRAVGDSLTQTSTTVEVRRGLRTRPPFRSDRAHVLAQASDFGGQSA